MVLMSSVARQREPTLPLTNAALASRDSCTRTGINMLSSKVSHADQQEETAMWGCGLRKCLLHFPQGCPFFQEMSKPA